MSFQRRFASRFCRWGGRLHRWGTDHPFVYYTLPVLGWAGLITWGCLGPPSEVPEFHIPYADKAEHALAYGCLGLLLLRGWLWERRPAARHVLTVIGLAAGWGLYIEFLQGLTTYRDFDPADMACNLAGAVAGACLWLQWPALRVKLAWPAPAASIASGRRD
ncbi:MAG: VanZ family protein [bacterium]|nr:VanZ family protein [bacterium]